MVVGDDTGEMNIDLEALYLREVKYFTYYNNTVTVNKRFITILNLKQDKQNSFCERLN